MAENSAPSLMENEQVRELLAILRENNSPTEKSLIAAISQIGAMERQLSEAVVELAAMRKELNEAQKMAHPVRAALQNAIKSMERDISNLRTWLYEVKQAVIEGCQKTLTAFRENGAAALDGAGRFFHVRPALEAMHRELVNAVKHDDKAIAAIEAASTEYHEAGRHMKNIARAFTGKEAITEARPPCVVAKTLAAPFRRERALFVTMDKRIDVVIGSLKRLEQRAAERKPSIQETLQTLNAKIAQEQQRPAPARRQEER